MIFITRTILKKLLLMSLLVILNTSVFSMVQEGIESLEQEVCDYDSDFDRDCNGEEKEDASENTSMCKKIMRCGRVALIAYLAVYPAHPLIQSVQGSYVHQHQKFKEWGDGPVRQTFDSLERANDVCRPIPAKQPGCCNAGNKDTLVCCYTNIKQCFSIPLDDGPNNNMYGFDLDGEPESFNSGNYMQRGNIPLRNRQNIDKQDLKESDDQEEEPIEIPDELFAYTVGGGSFAEDKADLIQACKRKGLSDQMKNLLLRALRKNYGR